MTFTSASANKLRAIAAMRDPWSPAISKSLILCRISTLKMP